MKFIFRKQKAETLVMAYSISFAVLAQRSILTLIVGYLVSVVNVPHRSPLAQMEEERREHVAKMKKMEMEMEQVFEMKVKEKVQKLKDSEAEVNQLLFPITWAQYPFSE